MRLGSNALHKGGHKTMTISNMPKMKILEGGKAQVFFIGIRNDTCL